MPLRRSSLHGLASKAALDKLNLESYTENFTSETLPTASTGTTVNSGVNSLAIAAARSTRRLRRAEHATANSSKKSTDTASSAKLKIQRNQAHATTLSTRRQIKGSTRVMQPRRVKGSTRVMRPRRVKGSKQQSGRRKSALLGKSLLASASTTALPATETIKDGNDYLEIFKSHKYYKCVDPRGANFRTKPEPEAVVGDGSGLDPGEVVRICARTNHWLKVDNRAVPGINAPRWIPERMYWGDNKVLFKVTEPVLPVTSPRVDVECVSLTLAEFNSIRFSTSKKDFPVIEAFDYGRSDNMIMITKYGQKLKLGMSLLTIGHWSLVRSKYAAVAAMLNARPDGDTLVLEVCCGLPVQHIKIHFEFFIIWMPRPTLKL